MKSEIAHLSYRVVELIKRITDFQHVAPFKSAYIFNGRIVFAQKGAHSNSSVNYKLMHVSIPAASLIYSLLLRWNLHGPHRLRRRRINEEIIRGDLRKENNDTSDAARE